MHLLYLVTIAPPNVHLLHGNQKSFFEYTINEIKQVRVFGFVKRAVSLVDQMLVELAHVFFGKKAQHVSKERTRFQNQCVLKSYIERSK